MLQIGGLTRFASSTLLGGLRTILLYISLSLALPGRCVPLQGTRDRRIGIKQFWLCPTLHLSPSNTRDLRSLHVSSSIEEFGRKSEGLQRDELRGRIGRNREKLKRQALDSH